MEQAADTAEADTVLQQGRADVNTGNPGTRFLGGYVTFYCDRCYYWDLRLKGYL